MHAVSHQGIQHSGFGTEQCLTSTSVCGCGDFVSRSCTWNHFDFLALVKFLKLFLFWQCSHFKAKIKCPRAKTEALYVAREGIGLHLCLQLKHMRWVAPDAALKKGETPSTMTASCFSRGARGPCSAEKTVAWLLFHISPQHTLAVSCEGLVWWRTVSSWALKAAARLLCGLQGGPWGRSLSEKGPYGTWKSAQRGRARWWGRKQHLSHTLSHANGNQQGSPLTPLALSGWPQPQPQGKARPFVGEKQPLWAPSFITEEPVQVGRQGKMGTAG